MRSPWPVLLSLWAGCADQVVEIRPYFDLPSPDSDAYPDPALIPSDLDVVYELHLALDGARNSKAQTTAPHGQIPGLEQIDFLEEDQGKDFVVHLDGEVGAQLYSYGRTCPFRVDVDQSLIEPQLYFSRVPSWGTTSRALPIAPTRTGGHAFTLDSGIAVFVGGTTEAIETFDPVSTGAFAAVQEPFAPRQGAVLTSFQNGSALIVGGTDASGDAVSEVSAILPGTDAARVNLVEFATGPAVKGHAAILLTDGSILVAGGETQLGGAGESFEATGEAWLFSLDELGDLRQAERMSLEMDPPRAYHTMVRNGDYPGAPVWIIGGIDANREPIGTVGRFDRDNVDIFSLHQHAILKTPRWRHASVRLSNGFILVLGGYTIDPNSGDEVPVTTVEYLNDEGDMVESLSQLPADAGVVDQTLTPLPDGRVLLAGGRDISGQPAQSAYLVYYDVQAQDINFLPTKSMQFARAGHSAMALCDGTIMVVGGTDEPAPAERYNPSVLTGRREYDLRSGNP